MKMHETGGFARSLPFLLRGAARDDGDNHGPPHLPAKTAGFAGPLRTTRVCHAILTNMIDVGEKTGDLDQMPLKIAVNNDQVDTLGGSQVSLLEPVMVIMLGGIVGTIVVALFLPIIELLKSGLGG
jgi:hypothetical protein